MDETIKRIIRLNVELEGVLRVAAERKSDEAIESARCRFSEMSALFASLDTTPASSEKDDGVKPAESESVAEVPPEKTPAEPEAGPAPEPAPEPAAPASCGTGRGDIRKLLTLNDKFLFRRELFGGNDAEFNDTLDLLESMASLQEAEEYLYDDMQWDADNDSVRDFMNIITGYFSQQSR